MKALVSMHNLTARNADALAGTVIRFLGNIEYGHISRIHRNAIFGEIDIIYNLWNPLS